ncbi:MAG: UDP-N-acetylmuramoyl-L-alanyl-D-glutamate--2,6-diaminopimelate ligase [Candidatus Omnitrophica bacterium]|nr:UDP-N-acetylmuramoyl-L-alanyl-D-glutamate--2,6-diaminopimelate ligase [Candidatus Omnitrophota bacterium]
MNIKLRDVLEGVDIISPASIKDMEISGIASHSRQVKNNFLFAAVEGLKFDGRSFIDEALARGAKVIVYNPKNLDVQSLKKKEAIFIEVKDMQKSLAKIADNFYCHPSSRIKVIGVTGTNGKTTITYLIESIIKNCGFKCGVIGTINYRFGERIIPAANTTPGSIQLQELIYEVSSHGLEQDRILGIDFKTGIFTNITMDHLDYHKTFESYFNAKARLFENLSPSSWAVINMDDAYGKKLLMRTNANTITYAIDTPADVEARDISSGISGSRFTIISPHGKIDIKTQLIGKHNIYNILAAVSFAISEKIDLGLIKKGIEGIESIPGRLEAIDIEHPFKVFVDYAHTDDALRNILLSARPLCRGKIILVFGCGGDRCRDKRPLMGKVASELADYVIVTTDNPRSEEPESIIKEIEHGFLNNFNKYRVILDRYAAIKEAICLAGEGDIVIIAGKGHEAYQVFKNTTIPFDDRSVVRQVITKKELRLNKEESPVLEHSS